MVLVRDLDEVACVVEPFALSVVKHTHVAVIDAGDVLIAESVRVKKRSFGELARFQFSLSAKFLPFGIPESRICLKLFLICRKLRFGTDAAAFLSDCCDHVHGIVELLRIEGARAETVFGSTAV